MVERVSSGWHWAACRLGMRHCWRPGQRLRALGWRDRLLRRCGTRLPSEEGMHVCGRACGCSCGDEPMESNAYCEVKVLIDKDSAEALFRVLK